MTVDKSSYWELRTRVADHQSLVARLTAAEKESQALVAAAFRQAGLDPDNTYTLNDADATAVEVTP